MLYNDNAAASTRTTRILTGIKPSGMPHIGNYVGAIRPALAAGRPANTESFYFLADLHGLINTTDPVRVQQSTLSIAATWLAAGLDPASAWFYRQSDIPEIAELSWLLSCVAGKGVLNRAHAYKAAVDRNEAAGEEKDAGVSAGLFTYPVLMAADILIFGADQVPVGRDQVQHIEMARDFAQRFEHVYGSGHFTLPEAVVDARVAVLPGLDGRKMSKSYDNTIPLFASRTELKKLIFAIRTNSKAPGESKQTEGSALFDLYRAFAADEEVRGFADAFADGIGWADAKARLFERVDLELAPLRDRYHDLVARPQDIEQLLREQAARLRARYAQPMLARLRDAVGLRPLSATSAPARPMKQKTVQPAFRQYREKDGKFYFKLLGGDGILLLQSKGYASPAEVATAIALTRQARVEEDLEQLQITTSASAAAVLAAVANLHAEDGARTTEA